MGSLIAGAIGGIGSLIGGATSKSSSSQAQGLDLTGYNYLTKGAGATTTNTNMANGVTASNGATGTQGAENQLLTSDQSNSPAFQNYLNSTGYNFQMDQGTRALTGSAAAKGLLDSGATAKAVTGYGQNLGSSYFNNYLTQLGGLNNQQQATANAGQAAASAAGGAGSAGGVAAGTAATAGGNAMANGISTAANQVGSAVGNNWSGISNFFGSL